MKLEDLSAGVRVTGLVPGETATVVAVERHGTDAVEVTYKTASVPVAQRLVYRNDEPSLTVATSASRPFDADAGEFKLVAEVQRIKLAGLFDPMLAVATSDVQPLPHQIRAVYGELLPRAPLRFLLADDPGAGKTIMAGLYIKELLLRDDVKSCLIVAPGGLVDQWQDELFFKFGLHFEILNREMADVALGASVFDHHPLLIARMDQLARNEDLQAQLGESEWDLVVVDEAHRMSAHYFGAKLEKSKRFQLGELLGDRARHLLLMTATPHPGIEENFQLFLTLLDKDRFAGKYRHGIHSGDTRGLMRRMIKEELLTFEGKPLFPKRVAETVPYDLTEAEQELYEQVTAYVRDGMNRADRLTDGKRRNTVGFALTVLQRRLASSPEAIYQSLVRRSERLERRKRDIQSGKLVKDEPTVQGAPDFEDFDEDDYAAEEVEQLEEELLDAATAAQTVDELNAELADLAHLTQLARQVRALGTDRKWSELRSIFEDVQTLADETGRPRKLIIFTEHRDTLDYLQGRLRSLLGDHDAVVAIHGGVRRPERRLITEEFTKNPEVQVLLATDAAGEGLNLQVAHLMVNYDLPWNPNRIEQRFGRIHRIGQQEVCRLWNLVATNTREGQVFTRLLAKVGEQSKAYGGKVFDVLGEAFEETPLRTLLLEAIRYGEQPEVKARMQQVIDASVGAGLDELMHERALAHDNLAEADLNELRRQMDEARARRLQPHYIEWAFRQAFQRLGGRIARREKGRFEIPNVPAAVRRITKHGPISTRYDRVTFDLDHVDGENQTRADLIAPGHPLHDAVADETVSHLHPALDRGTVLVSSAGDRPRLLVGVIEEVVDGTGESVGRRFGYAYVDEHGEVTPAGPAPYLDCVAAPASATVDAARRLPWLDTAESQATSWLIANRLPEFLNEVEPRRAAELDRVRAQVTQRLQQESNRLAGAAMEAAEREARGDKVKESSESLSRKANELADRLDKRHILLDRQRLMSIKPPRILTAALVLPLAMVNDEIPNDAPIHAVETKEVERRGVDLVLATERRLGRQPEEQAFNNPGFDVLSTAPDGTQIRIEVKARIEGSDDFFVTHNEVITGKNAAPNYRLAVVHVDRRSAEYDQVRYLDQPFQHLELANSDATGVRIDWAKTWAKGTAPF